MSKYDDIVDTQKSKYSDIIDTSANQVSTLPEQQNNVLTPKTFMSAIDKRNAELDVLRREQAQEQNAPANPQDIIESNPFYVAGKTVAEPIVQDVKTFARGVNELEPYNPLSTQFNPDIKNAKENIGRGVADVALGGTGAVINAMPSMMGINLASGAARPVINESVKKLGGTEKQSELLNTVFDYALAAKSFGLPVVRGMATGQISGLLAQAGINSDADWKKLPDQDKERIIGVAHNLGFFGGLASTAGTGRFADATQPKAPEIIQGVKFPDQNAGLRDLGQESPVDLRLTVDKSRQLAPPKAQFISDENGNIIISSQRPVEPLELSQQIPTNAEAVSQAQQRLAKENRQQELIKSGISIPTSEEKNFQLPQGKTNIELRPEQMMDVRGYENPENVDIRSMATPVEQQPSPSGEQVKPENASVTPETKPVELSREQKRALVDHGYSVDEVSKMQPKEALKLLGEKKSEPVAEQQPTPKENVPTTPEIDYPDLQKSVEQSSSPTSIPQFKDSTDAIEYGRQHPEQATELERLRTEAETVLNELSKNVTRENATEFVKAKSQSQFLREAAEAARNPQLETPIERVNKEQELAKDRKEITTENTGEIGKSSQRLQVLDIPVSTIKKDVDAFQNRKSEFSEESVQRILNAIHDKTFNWNEFDPILLWKNPKDGKVFVLSGHSRVEAFSRASAEGLKEFKDIPAKVIEGATKEQAQEIAKRSNVLGTRETPIERAQYYRLERERGRSDKSVSDEAKKFEGKDAGRKIALSYLNPSGRALEAVESMKNADTQSQNNAYAMGEWIGEVRKRYPELTDSHENELYNFLKNNFSKSGARTKTEFLERVNGTIEKRTDFGKFDNTKPLNIDNLATKSSTEKEYDQRIDDSTRELKDAEKARTDRLKTLIARNTPHVEIDRVLKKYNDNVTISQRNLLSLTQNKAEAMKTLHSSEVSLFDNIEELSNEAKRGLENRTTDEIEKSEPSITAIERQAESARTPEEINRAEQKIDEKLSEITVTSKENVSTTPNLRPAISKSGKGGQLYSTLPGLPEATKATIEFAKQDILPTVKGAIDTFSKTGSDIKDTFIPAKRGEAAKITASSIREHAGILARKKEIAYKTFDEASKAFDKETPENNLSFIDAVETGAKFNDPKAENTARVMRSMLEDRWKKIQRIKGSDAYIENYFPHIWKDPQKAGTIFAKIYGKRPLEGSKTYLKERTIPTVREGIERGLELESTNPVDLVIARVGDMDKFIMAHDIMNDLKSRGLPKYVSVFDKAPEGFNKIDDRVATVFGNPEIPVTEYVDALKYDKLNDVAANYGLKTERKMKIGGSRLGYAQQPNIVVTKFATPLGTLTHEIGHHLDWKFNLAQRFVNDPETKVELRKLADLRYEGTNVTNSYKRYVRKGEEKMANMIDAFVNTPDKFKEVAPNTWKKFNDLIDNTPELQPLREIENSLVRNGITSSVNAGGIIIRGNYYLPTDAARVINNYLSPGLSSNALFKIWRGMANTMNQVQLGLSGFHLMFTSNDAIISKVALGIQQIGEGKILQAGKNFAVSPVAPFTNYMRGNKLIQDYFRDDPEMPAMVNAVTRSGGRVKMDSFYKNSSVESFWKAWRAGNPIGAGIRSIPATIELLSKPIMEVIVPRQKLGVFSDMAKGILEKEATGKLTKDETTKALQEAWDSVDNRMGQLVYDNLFWNKALKDLGLASVRSLGWNIGTARELGGGILDVGKQAKNIVTGKQSRITPRMAYTIALPVVVGIEGAIMGYMLTGKSPEELKDYYFPKTGKKNNDGTDERVSLPSYMKDVFAVKEQGLGTVALHKAHPMVSMVSDMLNNEDFYNKEIRNPDDPLVEQFKQEMEYVGKQFIPFSVRNLQQRKESGGGIGQQVQSFIGITPAPRYIDQSNGQKLMEKYLGKRGLKTLPYEYGVKGDFTRGFVDKIKNGEEPTQTDFQKAYKYGLFDKDGQLKTELFLPTIEKRFNRLSLKEAAEVYQKMTPEEQSQVYPLLEKKMENQQSQEKYQRGLMEIK